MTEVYVPSRHSGGNAKLTLHTDPDCPRLSHAQCVVGPKPRSLYPDDTKECDWCNGDVDWGGGDNTDSLRRQIESGELDLVTDGGTDGRDRWRTARKKPVEVEFRGPYTDTETIETIEGDFEVDGEYIEEHGGYVIIRGVEGEVYPCGLDIFKETYEQVNSRRNSRYEDTDR